jgi:catechol 2,3-dioxygenase-like lactoylglutathione lyase family enzyme
MTTMAEGIHHVYVETHNFGKTAKFWQSLGFTLDEYRGTSGLFRARDGGPYVYVAEVAPSKTPVMELYLAVREETAPPGPVEVTAAFAATHWGTREMAIRDPDGRTLKLEAR